MMYHYSNTKTATTCGASLCPCCGSFLLSFSYLTANIITPDTALWVLNGSPVGARTRIFPGGICIKSQALPLASQRQKIRPVFHAEKLTRIVLAGELPLTPYHAPKTERFTNAGNGKGFIYAALWRHSRKGQKMKKRTRNNVVYLRLSDDEIRILNAKTKMSGLRDRSAFLRQLIVEGIVYDVDYSYLREYNAGLGKIGGNINQIAKRINETRSIYQTDIDEIKKEMEKLWQLQKFMLSKQPYREQ